jgi:hypothetical protein
VWERSVVGEGAGGRGSGREREREGEGAGGRGAAQRTAAGEEERRRAVLARAWATKKMGGFGRQIGRPSSLPPVSIDVPHSPTCSLPPELDECVRHGAQRLVS